MNNQILLINIDNEAFSEIRNILLNKCSYVENEQINVLIDERKNTNKNLDEKLTNIFMTIGIPANIQGYKFLRDSIKIAIKQPNTINGITNHIYPEIAQKYNTTNCRVDRAIRYAIEIAWNRGKIQNINSLFGADIYNVYEKPTNSELIALIADKLILENF